jgi:hypothetical protein
MEAFNENGCPKKMLHTESILIMATLEAAKRQNMLAADLPNAFIQT